MAASEQYKDVKEKTRRLVPWLGRQKGDLAIVTDGVEPERAQEYAELSGKLHRARVCLCLQGKSNGCRQVSRKI